MHNRLSIYVTVRIPSHPSEKFQSGGFKMEIITREDFIARVTKLVDKEAIAALTDLYLKSVEMKDSAKKATKQKAKTKSCASKNTESISKKEKQSFEIKNCVANDLIKKYAIGSSDHTMKRYYIINRISYRLKLDNAISVNLKNGMSKLNLKAGYYEIDSYVDNDGNHTVLKGFF